MTARTAFRCVCGVQTEFWLNIESAEKDAKRKGFKFRNGHWICKQCNYLLDQKEKKNDN